MLGGNRAQMPAPLLRATVDCTDSAAACSRGPLPSRVCSRAPSHPTDKQLMHGAGNGSSLQHHFERPSIFELDFHCALHDKCFHSYICKW